MSDPKWTNKWNAPAPLAALLGRDTYSRGASRLSCTQIIDSPRISLLKERHKDGVTRDISDRIWALFGTAVHKLIEDGSPHCDWHLKEERIFTEVEGWAVSGAIDCQVLGDDGSVELWDWKVTRAWSVKQEKREWVNQLNVLAYFVEKERGLVVKGLHIGALLRDWTSRQAENDENYPPSPIHVVDIPLWSYAEREAYVIERVRMHQATDMLDSLDEELPECTDAEMWTVPPTFAVMKKGGKRATKVFAEQDEAFAFAEEKGPDYGVLQRPGERLRCENYCEVAEFCSQRARQREAEQAVAGDTGTG